MSNNMNTALDKQALLKKLTDARLSIIIKYPFFGYLVMRLKLGIANVGTAATDMKRIIWDPQFLARLSQDEVEFVMMHEIMHCVLKHCMRGKELNQDIYNVACDIVVNSTILHYLQLTDFTVDGEVAMHHTPLGTEGHQYTAEQVYNMLMANVINQVGNANGQSGMGLGNGLHNGQNQSNNPSGGGKSCSTTLDNHGVWKNVPKSDKHLDEEWKKQLIDAYKGNKSYAPEGTALRTLIEDYEAQSKVDWKSVLNQFVQVVYDCKDYSFSPYDRRFSDTDFMLPAFNDAEIEAIKDLWFLVDASGSISDEMLGLVVSEIKSAVKQFDNISGKISFFDTEVSKPIEFDKEVSFPSYSILGGGGTSFFSIFEYMKEHMSEELPSAIIILTDGQAPYPPEEMAMEVPVLWILIDANEDAPWGVSTRIYTR